MSKDYFLAIGMIDGEGASSVFVERFDADEQAGAVMVRKIIEAGKPVHGAVLPVKEEELLDPIQVFGEGLSWR